MRKFILLFVSVLMGTALFAQTPGAAEKNAGNAAYKAKNYAEAFKNWEAYLKIVENKDNPCIYNTAVVAQRIKNYEAAVKYYDLSIANRYKLASSYVGKATALRALKKTDEMLATLDAGMKASPGNMKLETMYATHFLKEGQTFQKAGNEAKAAENYMKITELKTKSFQVQGFLSLAGLYFNDGAKILQDATPIATTDRAKYDAEKAKAVVAELRAMKLKEAAKKVEDGIEETLTYCDFPGEHWTRIRSNNVIERLNREIRRRTRVVGTFPDGNSALMLVCARLRHVAGTQWGCKKYMNMKHLEAALDDVSIAG